MRTYGTHQSLLVILLAAGCAEETASNDACARDFDCPVGQVCSGATSGEAGTCTAAASGAQREFGEVSMNFATGSESYLLSVFALPGGKEAAASSSYSVSLGTATGGAALRAARPLSDAARALEADPYWQARMAFEAERRQGIDALAASGTLPRPSAGLAKQALTSTCAQSCTTGTTCWQGTCTATPNVKFSDGSTVACEFVSRVTENGFSVDIFRDSASTASDADLIQAAQDFADAAAEVTYLSGTENAPAESVDRDGSGAVTVVFTDRLASLAGGIVGGFFYTDMLPTGAAGATGNNADLLWARPPSADTMESCRPTGCTGTITYELAVATLAHEYWHLVNFGVRTFNGDAEALREVLWLDEGVAHLVEDLTGWGASTLGAVAVALDGWPDATLSVGEDSVSQRGQAYLFLRHLVDQKARAAGATNSAAAAVRQAARALLAPMVSSKSKFGWQHDAFSARAEAVWPWLLATYATGNSDAISAAHRADFLAIANGPTGQPLGINPRGSIVTAAGVELDLPGPTLGDGDTDELTDFAAPFETQVVESGSLYFTVTATAPGTMTLVGKGDAQGDLSVRVERIQ